MWYYPNWKQDTVFCENKSHLASKYKSHHCFVSFSLISSVNFWLKWAFRHYTRSYQYLKWYSHVNYQSSFWCSFGWKNFCFKSNNWTRQINSSSSILANPWHQTLFQFGPVWLSARMISMLHFSISWSFDFSFLQSWTFSLLTQGPISFFLSKC